MKLGAMVSHQAAALLQRSQLRACNPCSADLRLENQEEVRDSHWYETKSLGARLGVGVDCTAGSYVQTQTLTNQLCSGVAPSGWQEDRHSDLPSRIQ